MCGGRVEGRVLHVSRPPHRIGKMEIIRVASWGGCMAGLHEGVAAGCRETGEGDGGGSSCWGAGGGGRGEDVE